MSQSTFNREPKPNPIFNIQKVFANDHHDARPRLYQTGNDRLENIWRISFSTKSYTHTFEVRIEDHAHDRQISVYAYEHGDELEVLSQAEYESRLETIQQNEPHPSHNPDLSLTREEAANLIADKVMVIDQRWFWMRVEDCVRRFESLEFIFNV